LLELVKKTIRCPLQRLVIIGVMVLWSQLSVGLVFALVSEPLHNARSPNKYIQNNDFQKNVSCPGAVKHAPEIKVGMRASEVLHLLGAPATRLENEWVYDFFACVPSPQVGQQVLAGLDIIFNDGAIKEIKYASVDATGPARAKKREKKHSRKPTKRVIAGASADKFI
jgi:hypothetical protein